MSGSEITITTEEYHRLLKVEADVIKDRGFFWDLDHNELDWELRKIDLQTMADR